ncbi:MAG: hypothetical protein IJS47_05310 [Clostridia bacterium]|nr:hypothetical protein [Clostridia bacterium]
MKLNNKIYEYLEMLNLKENFELIEHFVEGVEEFYYNPNISKEAKNTAKEALDFVNDLYNQLDTLVSMPPTEDTLNKIKECMGNVNLQYIWHMSGVMEEELKRLDNINKSNEQILLEFIKSEIVELNKKVDAAKKTLEKENQGLFKKKAELEEQKKYLAEEREKIEHLPLTMSLIKKENPFRRLIRILTEKSDTWSEEEINDVIILRNTNGEIRGKISKEKEETTEEIAKTEKNILAKRQKYGIRQKLLNLIRSEVFTVEPEEREQELNVNYLQQELNRGEIEKIEKQIESNIKKIEYINNSYQDFAAIEGGIIESYRENSSEKSSIETFASLVSKIKDFETILNKTLSYKVHEKTPVYEEILKKSPNRGGQMAFEM